MKLTQKLVKRLEYALRNAERAHRMIHDPSVAVARRSTLASTTLHYTRPDGAALYEIERAYGSDLVGLETCIAELRSIIVESLTKEGARQA